MNTKVYRREVLDKDNWEKNRMSFWLSAWLINYTWNVSARINLDTNYSEVEAIMVAPHVFRIDVEAYCRSSLHLSYLKKTKEGLRKLLN